MSTGRTILVVDDEENDIQSIIHSFPNDKVVALAIDHQRPDWRERVEEEFVSQLEQGCSHLIIDLFLHPADDGPLWLEYPLWLRLLRSAHERGLIGGGVDVHLWTRFRTEAAAHLDLLQVGLDGPTFAITDKPAIPTLSPSEPPCS